MELISFFIGFVLFVLLSSIFITSFFCITRGYVETLPDGSERRYGKILKGYFFFWFKEKAKVKIVYQGDPLAKLARQMGDYYKGSIITTGNPFIPSSINVITADKDIMPCLPLLRHELKVQFELLSECDEQVSLSVYEYEPVYFFPEWLRTVMAGCITCTPTVYGNLVFWVVYCSIKKEVFNKAFLSLFASPAIGLVIVWLAYWVSLAWTNTVLWKLYDS